MRKIIFLCLLAIAGLGLRAQQMVTVHWEDPGYLWDVYLNPATHELRDYCIDGDSARWLYEGSEAITPGYDNNTYKQFVVPEGVERIYGLAVPIHGTLETWMPYDDHIDLKIWQWNNDPEHTYLVDSVRLYCSQMRQRNFRGRCFEYHYNEHINPPYIHNEHRVDTLWEFFFDTAVAVHGIFYIGFNTGPTYYSNIGYPYAAPRVATRNLWAAFDQTCGWGYDNPLNWRIYQHPTHPLWLPILTPPEDSIDFACEVPQRPVLDQCDGFFADLSWQLPAVSAGLELSLFPDGGDPYLGTIRTLNPNATSLHLGPLTPGATYAVALRNLCMHQCPYHDTTWYSDWSDTLCFTLPLIGHDTVWNTDTLWINDSTGVVGGELVVLGGNATLLEINGQIYIILGTDTIAANDPRLVWIDDNTAVLGGTLVTISSGTPQGIFSPTGAMILREEYYDLLGRRLAQPPARGLYLLRTVTTNGATTRKIIKQ